MSESPLPERRILEDVPRIGYDIHMCPFPGALHAYLEYVGDPQDYDYLMGITGAPFRRFWNRDDGGNVDLSYLGDEPFRRAFEALGYDWRAVPANREAMIQAIKASLAQGRPVLSFGIIGPPEAGLVSGYAEDGAVLYGWSYFQDWPEFGHDRDTYYEKRDWFETMDVNAGRGLIVVGDKLPSRPTARDVLVASLEWAVELERTAQWPGYPDHVTGLTAYGAWADALEEDADYPPDDARVMGTRVMVHADQCTMLYERRPAAKYLRQMATGCGSSGVAPEVADPLNAAAALYDQAAGHVDKLWPWGDEMGPVAQQGLSQANARREFAVHVRAAGAVEAEAVAHLARALGELHKQGTD